MALVVGAEEITSALFGYGVFDEFKCFQFCKSTFLFCFRITCFAIIKVFSAFLFARKYKNPFLFFTDFSIDKYFNQYFFFDDIGFIIIPIATSISSWVNALLLFLKLIFK